MCNCLWPHGLQPARLLCPWDFPDKKYWRRLPFPPPGDLPDTGIEPASPALAGRSFTSEPSIRRLNWELQKSERCSRGKDRSDLKDEKDSTCHWWSEDGGSMSKVFEGLSNLGRDFRWHQRGSQELSLTTERNRLLPTSWSSKEMPYLLVPSDRKSSGPQNGDPVKTTRLLFHRNCEIRNGR